MKWVIIAIVVIVGLVIYNSSGWGRRKDANTGPSIYALDRKAMGTLGRIE